jgi:ABC-type branched-subunit amino acid transport system ATPase component
MSDYVLRTRDISKKYGDAFALEHVSVEIKQARFTG